MKQETLYSKILINFQAEVQKTISMDAGFCQIPLSNTSRLSILPEHWGIVAILASRHNLRWAGVWADQIKAHLVVHVCLEGGEQYLLLQTKIPTEEPQLASYTPYYPAADRPERHVQDMYGIDFINHPARGKRWTRHKAWDKNSFPLRKEFPVSGFNQETSPADMNYPFLKAQGNSLYEIPVGPIHAGIIEPGHFRFQAMGEKVLHLEERLGYVHKGIEKIAEGRDPSGLAKLAGRVSGDTTVGHTWAVCMAMESASFIQCPPRAVYLRAIMTELERINNHLWDMAAMCNDVGFAFGNYQFGRLRERWMRLNRQCFGHRLMMDQIIPGGVACNLSDSDKQEIENLLRYTQQELKQLIIIIDANSSLEDRFFRAGILTPEQAAALGALGYVGRSSGQTFDARQAPGYAPYRELKFTVPVEEYGDVAARFWVRYKELRVAKQLIEQLLTQLPPGNITTPWQIPSSGNEGFAFVEGWRGEILCYVRFGVENRIARYFPRDPSQINWPALEKIQIDNIVPDFPICNKSVNCSYSGQDL